MTSAQRAKLRSMANNLDPVILVGKDGLSESIIASADEAITARELIKGSVQKSCEATPREICDALAKTLGAEGIQVIGRRFVLYRRNEKEQRIVI